MSTGLDIDAVKAAIRDFNGILANVVADRLLHEQFTDLRAALEPHTVAKRVVLLDMLYGTQMSLMQRGAVEAISASLEHHATEIIDSISRLEPDVLEKSPARVVQVAMDAARHIVHPDVAGTSNVDRNPVFAAKFLHWTTRVHFPIIDRKAKSALHRIFNLKLDVSEEDYPRWIHFYSEVISGLTEAQRAELLEVDAATQPVPAYAVNNTLLRVLDKYLYWEGRKKGPA